MGTKCSTHILLLSGCGYCMTACCSARSCVPDLMNGYCEEAFSPSFPFVGKVSINQAQLERVVLSGFKTFT